MNYDLTRQKIFRLRNVNYDLTRFHCITLTIHVPVTKVGVGKIAVIANPAGASFAVIEMSVAPEEWVD